MKMLIDIPTDVEKRLRGVKKLSGHTDLAVIIRNALALYEFAQKAKNRDAKILVEETDGTQKEVIIE